MKIKDLKRITGESLSSIERNTGVSNRYLVGRPEMDVSSMRADKLFSIAKYLNVSMEKLIEIQSEDIQDMLLSSKR